MGAVDFFAREFATKTRAYGDLLRHESLIAQGVILGKGGELISSFRYRGQDLQCASVHELEAISLRVNAAVKKLGTGWMWHVTNSRTESSDYSESGAFPDAVSRAVDNERREQYRAEGQHFENDYVLTLTYLPPILLKGKLRNFLFESDAGEEKGAAAIGRKEIDYFIRMCGNIVSEVATDLGGMVPLASSWSVDKSSRREEHFDDQMSFLLWCTTGLRQRVRLPVWRPPVGLDVIIGSQPFCGGIRPRVGNKHIRVISLETPPEAGTEVGMLDVLNRLPVAFRWTTRWICRDPHAARAEVNDSRKKWRQKIRGLVDQLLGRTSGQVDQDAVDMAADAEAALTDLSSGVVSYGHYTSTIILMDEDAAKLEAAVRYVCKVVSYRGFVVRDEDVNAVEAFLGSIPGHGYENVRRPLLHSINLSHLLPLSSVWQGPLGNPCGFYQKYYPDGGLPPPLFYGAADGGTPFRVVLHQGDVGHSMVIGPTGAGKSVLLGLMALQHFRYPNAKVFSFEKGESMFVACKAAGGDHYGFMSEDSGQSIGLCPFARVDRAADRAWALDYVEVLCELNGVKVDLAMRKEVGRALELLGSRPAHMRSFTDLGALIQTPDIRAVLALYESQYAGGMLNAREDSISLSRFTVFEMEQLMELGDKHVVPVLLYLFRAVERALDGSPVMIILDEAWLMLDHPLFEEKIREWLKVLRKANAFVVFATQELEDLAKSRIKSTLYQACKTRILLPNPAAASEDGAKLYRELGLTPREMQVLALGTAKRDYFFSSPEGRRMFQLELGKVAFAFVATSGKDDRKLAREMIAIHKNNWVAEWLREKGVGAGVLGGKWAT